MGLRPTRGNENPRRPREKPALSLQKGGVPRRADSRSPACAEDKLRGNDASFDGVIMGLRPTRGNENPRRPREKPALSLPKGGGPHQVDSRLRGNDVTFEGATPP